MRNAVLFALVFGALAWCGSHGWVLYGGEAAPAPAQTCACARCAELERRVAALEKAEAERKRRRAEFQRKAKPERAIDQVREKVRRHAVKPEKGANLNGKAVGK